MALRQGPPCGRSRNLGKRWIVATVRFTPHLSRFFPLPAAYDTEAASLAALVEELDARWPGLGFYITDERGVIRQHVAVWVDGELIRDRTQLSEPLDPESQVTILQALTGG